MSFESKVREYWPDVADQVLGIVRGTLQPCEVDDSIERWYPAEGIYPATPSRNRRFEDKMQAIDKLIDGHGYEAYSEPDAHWPLMSYSNQGDVYLPTIMFLWDREVFRVGCIADWFDENVREPSE